MRRGIGLRGYAQQDPLNEFRKEAYRLYEELRDLIRRQVATTIFRVTVKREAPRRVPLPGPRPAGPRTRRSTRMPTVRSTLARRTTRRPATAAGAVAAGRGRGRDRAPAVAAAPRRPRSASSDDRRPDPSPGSPPTRCAPPARRPATRRGDERRPRRASPRPAPGSAATTRAGAARARSTRSVTGPDPGSAGGICAPLPHRRPPRRRRGRLPRPPDLAAGPGRRAAARRRDRGPRRRPVRRPARRPCSRRGWTTRSTLWHARARAQAFVVTGGKLPGDRTTEAAVARRYAIDHGVPASAIFGEDEAHNTLDSLHGRRRASCATAGLSQRDLRLGPDPHAAGPPDRRRPGHRGVRRRRPRRRPSRRTGPARPRRRSTSSARSRSTSCRGGAPPRSRRRAAERPPSAHRTRHGLRSRAISLRNPVRPLGLCGTAPILGHSPSAPGTGADAQSCPTPPTAPTSRAVTPTAREGRGERELVKQAEEAQFVDLIACERDCRNCSYAAALDCDGNCGVCPHNSYCPCVNPVVARSKTALRLIELRPILLQDLRCAPKWTPPPLGTWRSGSGRPRGVFDLAAKETRVAELDARAIEPGFWDDQRAAQKVVREAQGLRDEVDTVARAREARRRTSRSSSDLLADTPDADTEADVAREADALGAEFARERTLLLFSGEYDAKNAVAHDQRRRGRDRGHRLGRDAPADVPPLVRAPPVQGGRRSTRSPASRPGSRARRSPSPGGSPTAGCAPSAASTASSGSAPTTPRTAARRRSPWSRSCPRRTTTSRSSSTGTRSGSTRSARRAPAGSTSRRPSPRSGSPTCPPGSSSPARTSAPRPRTASSRSASSSPGSSSSSWRSARRSCASCAAST